MAAYLAILSTILVRVLGVLILLKALSSQQLGAGGTTLAGRAKRHGCHVIHAAVGHGDGTVPWKRIWRDVEVWFCGHCWSGGQSNPIAQCPGRVSFEELENDDKRSVSGGNPRAKDANLP